MCFGFLTRTSNNFHPTIVFYKTAQGNLSFLELEKKGTARGCSASERGDEPRSGKLLPLKSLMLPSPSSSTKQEDRVARSSCFVELEGVEPSSKQVTDVLSTCLFRG